MNLDVQIILTTQRGKSAVENNYLAYWQKAKFKDELEKCGSDNVCQLKTKLSWVAIDAG